MLIFWKFNQILFKTKKKLSKRFLKIKFCFWFNRNVDSNPNIFKQNTTFEPEDFTETNNRTGDKLYQPVLECIPYANSTPYDYLTSIERRTRHENVPEPELITWFDKKGTIQNDDLVNRLLKLKEQVS